MQSQTDFPSSAAHIHQPSSKQFDGGHGFSHRSKLGLFLMWVFTAPLGGHRFYLGDIRGGVVQLVLTIFTMGLATIFAFFDGIFLLFTRNEDEDGKVIHGWRPAPSGSLEEKRQPKFYREFLAGKDPREIEKGMDQEALLLLFLVTLGSIFGGAFLAPFAWYLMTRQGVIRQDVGLPSSILVTITKWASIVSSLFGILLLGMFLLNYIISFGLLFAMIIAGIAGLF